MTLSQRAIEAAAKTAYERNRDGSVEWQDVPEKHREEWREKVRPVLTAALAVEDLCLVEIGSLSEHKLGAAWFQRTFGVPLGDKPSGKKSDEILSLIAAASDGEDSPPQEKI